MMKRVMAIPLILTFGAGMALAQKPTVADELKKIETEWVNAQKAKNADKLAEILADGWVGLDWDGKTTDKATAVSHMKMPGYSLESIEMGPMTVRVFGNTAVVMGSDTEKGMEDGKDASGKFVWTDVFVKQNGKWRAVASQSTKVP
jgi:ketosteroid isomerase-like protein